MQQAHGVSRSAQGYALSAAPKAHRFVLEGVDN